MTSMTPLEKAAQRSRHLLPSVAIALLACFGLSACTAPEAPSPEATTEARTVPPLPTIPPLPDNGDIAPGTYLVTSFKEDFEITVPDGWVSEEGDGLLKDDPDHPDDLGVFVGWWPALYVPRDACAWEGALVEVNSSAKAFVDAMTAQTSTASTPPVEVMVGNYSGVEFDHSVEGDVDFKGCDRDKFCIHSEFSNECSRWYSTQTERETYRVVNLNGQRAMFWVVQFHESINPELIREARAVFDSIVFKVRQVTS
ncbi:hypothetical protein M8J71_11215 [Pseudarthrobacter sp. R1]|uniref:hypothetical protein n=1 Tax=Pseudarthrobacter sp. R1 TaxID=2944934 RepID=UPI00210998F1|nr:hypothetical protein [Pseudarthrobacter sp. R1]MCQ6271051.1 hypothetical protein [Pseudarthrobacter sp. R1]